MKRRKELETGGPPIGDRLQQKAALAFEPKRKPRGRPFPKGNRIGHRWKKGESGNPGGLPGKDLAAIAARRLFEAAGEGNLPKIPKGFNAYAYNVLADRAYGKVAQGVDMNMNGRLTIKQVLEAQERAKKWLQPRARAATS